MRLINCTTLRLEEFFGDAIPKYAILSHTWEKEEVTFAEFTSEQNSFKAKNGYAKIKQTCAQAKSSRFRYAWVDTCCIDKSSSAELSEAINSMFQWYRKSAVCYAYLSDVAEATFEEDFPKSRWFRRGWTLQELLAPSHVIFFDQAWKKLTDKWESAHRISNITKIDMLVLKPRYRGQTIKLSDFCVAKRMSWASSRETTRVEDIAYCLLGIFDVSMPLLYGEGEKAFARLQEEIIKGTSDDSILAWDLDREVKETIDESFDVDLISTDLIPTPNLAKSPRNFKDCDDLNNGNFSHSSLAMTNFGLQVEMPIARIDVPTKEKRGNISFWLAVLNASISNSPGLIGIILQLHGSENEIPNQFKRLRFGFTNSRSTMLLGPRLVSKAVQSQFTLPSYRNSQAPIYSPKSYRQVLINISSGMEKLGYSTVTAGGARGWESYQEMYAATWNPKTNVFTVRSGDYGLSIFVFAFEPNNYSGLPPFSILIYHDTIIMRQGSSFSDAEILHMFRNFSPIDNTKSMILESRRKGDIKVEFTVKDNHVRHWQITEVDIDAVEVVSEESTSIETMQSSPSS